MDFSTNILLTSMQLITRILNYMNMTIKIYRRISK